jgi:hypothetical protein
MAQVVENWSEIRGRVVDATPSTSRPDFVDLIIDADEVDDIDGFANLLADVAGTQIDVLVPRAALPDDLDAGTAIICQVRRARSGLFAHPDHVDAGPTGDDAPGATTA